MSSIAPPAAPDAAAIAPFIEGLAAAVLVFDHERLRRANREALALAGSELPALCALVGEASGDFCALLASGPDARLIEIRSGTAVAGIGRLVILRDVGVQAEAYRTLHECDSRFDTIRHATLDAMVVMDAQGRIRSWNRAAERMFGWQAAEALGQDLHAMLAPPEQRAAFIARASDWPRTGQSPVFGTIHRLPACHRDGRALVVELSLSAYHMGTEWLALGIVRDVTDRAADEARLRDAEARWKFALEGAGDAVWDWDVRTGQCLMGAHYKALLGYAEDELEDTIGAIRARVHPDDRAGFDERVEAYRDGRLSHHRDDLRMRNHSGSYRWIHSRGMVTDRDADGRPIRVVGTHRDVTDQRAAQLSLQNQLAETQRLNERLESMQVQLVQAEKLSSIGQLAAGVAHEMNTPLAFVSSNVTTLESYVGSLLELVDQALDPASGAATLTARARSLDLDTIRDDLPALFDETRDGLKRVQRVVRDLKDFSRVGEHDWAYCDIHTGLESTLNILRNEIKHKAQVVRDYGMLPELWCAPSQLNQVFMNLLVNAVQAIDAGGTITLRTRLDEDEVRIEVCDDGPGIAPERQSRIFDPFYTTKPVGVGTGLGLSIAADIVRKHNGAITVSSTPGGGCTFTLRLPLARPAATTPEDLPS